jgi:osmotically-inducible protein OsmY
MNTNASDSESTDPLANQSDSVTSLENEIRNSFDQLGYQQLNSIDVSTVQGKLTLNGQLASYYLKQVAQSVAVKTAGATEVENLIEVV